MLTALCNASLAGITDKAENYVGIAVGNAAAAASRSPRALLTDASARRVSSPAQRKVLGGRVLPTFGNDPNAWVKDVKPFLIKGASQFRSDGPYEPHEP